MAIKKLLTGFRVEIERVLSVANQTLQYHSSRPFWAKSGVPLPNLHHDCKQLQDWYDWLHAGNLISDAEPICVFIRLNVFPTSGTVLNGTALWLYQDDVYQVTGEFTDEEKKLLIMEHVRKQAEKFSRLRAKLSSGKSDQIKYSRKKIPEEVRIEVWRRDQGKCASCGSREKLEYDHIVPISRGGSNTTRNVELLCEVCNRAKGDRIQ